jgi:thioesterase domain-containing protein/acyl carrier protein
VHVVNLAGEALLGHVVDRVYAEAGVRAVYNLYGPSEDTTYSTGALCVRDSTRAPDIGTPIHGCEVYVVDEQGLLAPRGATGELYIGGTGLSRGYWQRPELTAEKFVPGERIGVATERLYRTGDLVRWNERGTLEFIGRLDQQVKLNGFRVELGEIEAALSASGVVRSSAVLKFDGAGSQRLVAFVEYLPDTGMTLAAQEEHAKAHLRAMLPGFMLPQEWVAMDTMLLSANGKTDRKAVRAWYESEGASRPGQDEAPATAEESWLVALWKRLLKADRVGVNDNFFALGGKSLLALQVVNAINKELGCQLSMVDLFRYPTIRQLLDRAAASVPTDTGQADGGPVSLQRSGQGRDEARALFLVHPIGGDVVCYHALVDALRTNWDIYGFQMEQSHRSGIADLAKRYVAHVKALQPQGPYHIAGYSLGGTIAYEMARQLAKQGDVVGSVAVIDSMLHADEMSTHEMDLTALAILLQELGATEQALWKDLDVLARMYGIDHALDQVLSRAKDARLLPPTLDLETLRQRYQVYRANWEASLGYVAGSYAGPVHFMAATRGRVPWDERGWQRLVATRSHREIDCDHAGILKPPHVQAVANWLRDVVEPQHVDVAVLE